MTIEYQCFVSGDRGGKIRERERRGRRRFQKDTGGVGGGEW